jgi:hypothetical protein
MTQFELLDTLDKRVQQSSMTKLFLTSNFLQCGIGLFGITILAAQFPQVYSPKIPIGISCKSFLSNIPICANNFCRKIVIYEFVSNVNKR